MVINGVTWGLLSGLICGETGVIWVVATHIFVVFTPSFGEIIQFD